MKRLILALGLLLALSAPSSADVVIQDLSVIWQGRKSTEINIRVTVANPAGTTQQGPVVVSLFVRHRPGDVWRKVQEWDDIAKIQPGYKVSRDYFASPAAPPFDSAIRTASFQVKAVATTPDGQNVEQVRTIGPPR